MLILFSHAPHVFGIVKDPHLDNLVSLWTGLPISSSLLGNFVGVKDPHSNSPLLLRICLPVSSNLLGNFVGVKDPHLNSLLLLWICLPVSSNLLGNFAGLKDPHLSYFVSFFIFITIIIIFDTEQLRLEITLWGWLDDKIELLTDWMETFSPIVSFALIYPTHMECRL